MIRDVYEQCPILKNDLTSLKQEENYEQII